MNITEIHLIATTVISVVGGFFARGWYVWGRKKAGMSAEMATKEFADVNEMIGNYMTRVDELAEEITALKLELIDVKTKYATLKKERDALKAENNDLRAKHDHNDTTSAN